MGNKTCSFFGHREVNDREALKKKVLAVVEKLIEKGFSVFLFGGFGDFDELCHEVVTLAKGKHPTIQRVYCLSEEKHLRAWKRPKWLKDEDYEEFIYLPLSYDYWYARIYYRNCAMIEKSDYVVFYAESREDSGAYKALKFAVKRKKELVNLFD